MEGKGPIRGRKEEEGRKEEVIEMRRIGKVIK